MTNDDRMNLLICLIGVAIPFSSYLRFAAFEDIEFYAVLLPKSVKIKNLFSSNSDNNPPSHFPSPTVRDVMTQLATSPSEDVAMTISPFIALRSFTLGMRKTESREIDCTSCCSTFRGLKRRASQESECLALAAAAVSFQSTFFACGAQAAFE